MWIVCGQTFHMKYQAYFFFFFFLKKQLMLKMLSVVVLRWQLGSCMELKSLTDFERRPLKDHSCEVWLLFEKTRQLMINKKYLKEKDTPSCISIVEFVFICMAVCFKDSSDLEKLINTITMQTVQTNIKSLLWSIDNSPSNIIKTTPLNVTEVLSLRFNYWLVISGK